MAASFVDTNILVYAHDASAGRKQDRAQELLNELWLSGEGCLSVQVLPARIIQDLSAWQVHIPGPDDVLRTIERQGRNPLSF